MTLTSIGILFIISLCQTTILPHLSILGSTPDIYLIFIVFFSLNSEVKQSALVNWVSGIAKDLFSGGIFGLSSFLFIIIGYAVNRTKGSIFKEHPLSQILVTFLAALFYGLGYIFFSSLLSEHWRLSIIIQKAFLSALYAAAIVPSLFWLFKKARTRLGLRETITFEKKV